MGGIIATTATKSRKLKTVFLALAGAVGVYLVVLFVVFAPLYSIYASWMANGLSYGYMKQFADKCQQMEKSGDASVIRDISAGQKRSDIYACPYVGMGDNWSGAVYYPGETVQSGGVLPQQLKSFFGIEKCLMIKEQWYWCYAT